MVKIVNVSRHQRFPVIQGRVMIDAVRGVLRVRAWPRSPGPPRSALQRFWIDWFKQANLLAKYADPMSQVRSKEMAEGSGMYPRDVLLKAMRGRLYNWTTPDGWRWYPVAAIGDISETLDVLAQTVGSLLVRATDRWRTPEPGVIDDVLTLKGNPAIPAWAAGGGGGVVFGGALVNKTSDQAILNATFTAVTFDSETYDTDAIHDPVTNPSRLTVPAGWTKVRLTGSIRWISNSSGHRVLNFRKNGLNFPGQSMTRQLARGTSENSIASPAFDVIEDDYFELFVLQTRGVTHNVNGLNDFVTFGMERVT